MRRTLNITAAFFTLLELGALAALLRIFLAMSFDQVTAAAFALLPVIAVLVDRWILSFSPNLPPERVAEELVRIPRRILFLRSLVSIAVGVFLVVAFSVATRAHLSPDAATVMAGGGVGVVFTFSNLRSLVFRRVLDPLARQAFTREPMRYEARTIRERLFVAANVLGFAGTAAAAAYSYFVVGAPMKEYADLIAFFPVLILILSTAFGVDLIRATRPLVFWGAGIPGATAERALSVASNLPYRLALSNLVAWVIAAGAIAFRYFQHGAARAETLEVFAGVVAVGCGVVLYQAVWHRALLAPLREGAALASMESGHPTPRSRLSIQLRLVFTVLLLMGFGGTFAGITVFAQYERRMALEAEARASDEARSMLQRAPARSSYSVADLPPRTKGRVVLEQGGPPSESDPQAPPDDRIEASDEGTLILGKERLSAAWRRIDRGSKLVVYEPWVSDDPAGAGPVAFVFGFLLVATFGAILVFQTELTAPIRDLELEARRLGRGELDHPIVATEVSELGQLANAMEMSRRQLRRTLEEIRELNASLERRVRDRTVELEDANAELGRAMKALADAQEQVVNTEKLASLGRLSAGIAHEVNNPLNFVKNSIPPLKESLQALDGRLGASDPKLHQALSDSREVIQIMENGVDRMSQTLRALLDFSRQSPSSAATEDVDLRAAVDSALALLRHELKDRVEVVTFFEGPLIIRGSSGQIGQFLMNVIKNAAHAVLERNPEQGGKIDIRAIAEGDRVVISIADNGCGMPPEAVARAFEPFFTTKPVGRGTGLGLAIVHGIVEKHGGTVELSSALNEGTTVRVALPRRPSA